MTKTTTVPEMTKTGERLVLVDGHGLAFRAFFALPPSLATSAGEVTNATFGFTSMLLDVLRDHTPDYILVTFDVGRTFRHEQFEDYKAHRKPMPEELGPQLSRIREVLSALNIPVYEADGFEADDVIGTLCCQAAEHQIQAYVVTGDSDLLQLVNDHVRVVMPGRQRFGDYRIFDHDAVVDRYGFGPERVIDYKALVGDTSDNIPGVPGVGDKTAKNLIKQFTSLDEIYEHIDEITPTRARNALAENRDSAYESRELVTVICDVPVKLALEQCHVHDFERESVVTLFQELEFRSLLNKLPQLPQADGHAIEFPATSVAMGEPVIVADQTSLEQLASEIAGAATIAVDVETDSVDQVRANLTGIAIATAANRAYYVSLNHRDSPTVDLEAARLTLQPVLAAHENVVTHHGKYDLAVLKRHGFDGITIAFDTMLAAYLLGEKALGLKDLAFNRLGWEMTPIEDLIGKGKKQITMDQVPVEQVAPYACADVAATIQLEPQLRRELEERDQVSLLREMEVPLIPVLLKMELAGIALNVDFLRDLRTQLESQIHEIRQDIFSAVGHEFNLNSPSQLAGVLFDEIGLQAGRRTKTGYSVNQNVLEGLKGAHDAVDLILEYRTLAKLQSTYVEALPSQVNPESGRIHTTFNQTIAATGRLSSIDPNLQNIPVRTRLGRQVRHAFVADNRPEFRRFDEEAVLFGVDYSQMELRLMAHYSQDPALVEAFQQKQDIHATTAAEVFGVPMDEITPDQRATAKVVNFGIMYGMQAWGVSRDTGMSRQDAQAFIDQYLDRFQGVKSYIDQTIEEAVRTGYVSTLYGRRRYLPDITSRGPRRQAAERAAINMPIQGTAADIMKLAMLEIDERLAASNLRSIMILQVHDELIFEAPRSELGPLREIVSDAMTKVVELSIPLEVEAKYGADWEDMQPME